MTDADLPPVPCEPPPTAVRRAVTRALEEDLEPLGDVSATLVSPWVLARARYVARGVGVIAGSACVVEAAAQVSDRLVVEWSTPDGSRVQPGAELGTISGPLVDILRAERTSLNFLCHLSGVATLTRAHVDAARGRCDVLDTRKTTPGLRALEKAAVRAGGGRNHRGSLSEMVMLKDNHLAGLGIAAGVAAARDSWPHKVVEVECDRIDQVREALEAGADAVLCDNMTPPQVAECVALVRAAPHRCRVEVSGGIDLTTIADYAAAGPDHVSVGALTHSAPVLDIGLDLTVDEVTDEPSVPAPQGG